MIPEAVWKKNDRKANLLIYIFSAVVFTAVVVLGRVKLNINAGFDVHIFAKANAVINSCVAVLLIIALIAVKNKKFSLHKNLMLAAMFLSILFLVSYICHHLLSGETRFGDTDHDGIISETEKAAVGSSRMIYYIILGTHIPLAGLILPFVLFSAYRALTGEFARHKKLVRITWPVWFYVAVTGVIVYLMISPYYGS
jgi:putative membrane protein